MKIKNLYISSTSKENGTLIVAMGIMEILKLNLQKIAFFRPIIKNRTVVDNNINFIIKHFNLNMDYEDSFVYDVDEVEELILNDMSDTIMQNIIEKYNYLESRYDFLLIEGLSSPNFSQPLNFHINYKIAKNLNSGFINVINLKDKDLTTINHIIKLENSSISRNRCNHFATFLNRVSNEYLDILKDSNSSPKVFVLPENSELNLPTINDILTTITTTKVLGRTNQLNRVVRDIKIATMQTEHILSYIKEGDLFISAGDRMDVILAIISANYSNDFPSVAGIILTGGFEIDDNFITLLKGLKQFTIPIYKVSLNTYDTVMALQNIQPKISINNHRKIALSIGMFHEHIDSTSIEKLIVNQSSDIMTPLMFEYSIFKKARENRAKILLPEAYDDRILRASEILLRRGVVDIVLLGNIDDITNRYRALGLELSNIEIIDPKDKKLIKRYGKELYRLRKDKGVELKVALDMMNNIHYFATMMVKMGVVDGMVSGAIHTTAETIRPALEIIKTKPSVSIVSSLFFMLLPEKVLIYADCAINQNPNPQELAQIAISTASTASSFGIIPKVAMLSYSTGNSGSGKEVEKVVEATKIVKEREKNLLIEGPLQYDSAIDKSVANIKLPNSKIAGEATVLIFPDLNTGNNTYKAVQRSSNTIAIGPILQGLNAPINDLSRGCKVIDIVNTVVITAIQAKEN
ncbi:Phosphate acetyltransferase [hydrothermal vent metagenome]|uniref:Phosphate acetyltransferase n=1 Tax=hydrothermal vent metagenome TaxID=652676 RepID=A0A1W1EHX4_9ZZZZ